MTLTNKKILRGLYALFGASLLVLTIAPAHAAPINSDLSITGSVAFDQSFAAGALFGGATQSGNINATQGGVNSSSPYSGATAPATNPLNGTLSNTGDGFGFSGSAFAPAGGDQYGIGIDLGINLANSSATTTYVVVFRVDFSNQVNAGGNDAYTESEFSIKDALLNELFFTHLISDTLFENQKNGNYTGAFGGIESDNGFSTLTFTLNPGASLSFDGTWTLRSLVNDGNASADLTTFISVDSVTGRGGNPNPVPAPATLLLVMLGAAAMRMARRNVK